MADHELRAAVESHTTDYELEGELHRIRPHRTHEIRYEGERAVCKLSTHHEGTAGLEGRILAAVGERTSLPVPEVLAIGDDHFVARWHDAVPQEPPDVTDRRVREIAHGLATLHAETEDWFDSSGLLRIPDSRASRFTHTPAPTWGDTLGAFIDRRARYLEGIGYGDVACDVRAWFEENRTQFDAVEDAVLVHGNFFGEHVGVDADAVSAVIDFEHALVGSPEWDYVRTVLPVFGPSADHEVSEAVFRDAYESVRPLPVGFDDRRESYVTLTFLSYLRSLHLQRGNRDETHAVAQRMRFYRRTLRERIAFE